MTDLFGKNPLCNTTKSQKRANFLLGELYFPYPWTSCQETCWDEEREEVEEVHGDWGVPRVPGVQGGQGCQGGQGLVLS